ncbi:hypothetical protein [Amphibacillus cookii]|uniref:hypothetical protein n=1 Tax=Amphibacillus cookii TaxID=767787 RepID=UPI0019567180|nr:hypothetical protein [Amphibacillus cookii]MBM7542352.1 hypothetical protein [Amphibacillus cookii]
MNQDINKIMDVVSMEWSNQLAQANKKIAVLVEENERLKQENQQSSNQDQPVE